MRTTSADRLRTSLDEVLSDVEAGASFVITRNDRAIALIEPIRAAVAARPRTRSAGSNVASLPRHEIRSAESIDALLAHERAR